MASVEKRQSLNVPPSSASLIPRPVGVGGGLLAAALMIFSGVGAIWGLLRPRIAGQLIEGGAITVTSGAGAEFVSFASFLIISGFLGAAFAIYTFLRYKKLRGVGMLFWLMFIVFAGAMAMLAMSDLTAGLAHANSKVEQLSIGSEVSFAPGFNPGIGWIVAPLFAAICYWSFLVNGIGGGRL